MAVTCDPVANPCGSDKCPATLNCLWNSFVDPNTRQVHFGIIGAVINATLIFVGVIAVAMVIFSGFKFITSQADKKALESAQKTFQFAILGILVVVLSFFFLNIIGAATGVTCIEPINILQKGFNACQ